MFSANVTNKYPLSQKRGEYIVKISYRKGKAAYLCGCKKENSPYYSESYESLEGNLFRKEVKVFSSVAEAIEYCKTSFDIRNNAQMPYRLTVVKRPKELYAIRCSRGFGWEYVVEKKSKNIVVTTHIDYAKLYSNRNTAETVAKKWNTRNFAVTNEFEVVPVTEKELN